jgi:hypothetical protein
MGLSRRSLTGLALLLTMATAALLATRWPTLELHFEPVDKHPQKTVPHWSLREMPWRERETPWRVHGDAHTSLQHGAGPWSWTVEDMRSWKLGTEPTKMKGGDGQDVNGDGTMDRTVQAVDLKDLTPAEKQAAKDVINRDANSAGSGGPPGPLGLAIS